MYRASQLICQRTPKYAMTDTDPLQAFLSGLCTPPKLVFVRQAYAHCANVPFRLEICLVETCTGPCGAVGSASNSRAGGPGFDTRSNHILSFFLPLNQEGQLSVTCKNMCTKFWLGTAEEV